MVIVPSVTMKELILALVTSSPFRRPTRAPPATAAAMAPGKPRRGWSPIVRTPAKVITVPMERSSWPQIITTVKPIATVAFIAMALRMVVKLKTLKNFGADRDMKAKTTTKRM
jgi:hypothetical protein